MSEIPSDKKALLSLIHSDPERVADLILSLVAHIEKQEILILSLRVEIRELKARLGLDSQNSSKPPSSDGYKKPPTRSLRTKSGRKTGGQKGHPGHCLSPVDSPDIVISYRIDCCPECGEDLSSIPEEIERRQVFELPKPKLEVTEHQIHRKACPRCRKTVKGIPPPEVVAPVAYGPRFLTHLVVLREYQYLPLARLAEMVWDQFHVPVSESTILSAVKRFSKKAAPLLETIKASLSASDLLQADESGLRVKGKLQWIHIACNSKAEFLGLHEKRGTAATSEIGILPKFSGTLITDFFSSYLDYSGPHGFCNAHILRELNGIIESFPEETWASPVRDFLLSLQKRKVSGALDRINDSEVEAIREHFRSLVDKGIEQHPSVLTGRKKRTISQALLRRLHEYRSSVLLFVSDPKVPFTNNEAERGIRMPKLRQKIAGAFRTEEFASLFLGIRSIIGTLKKNDKPIFESLLTLMTTGSLPDLLPP